MSITKILITLTYYFRKILRNSNILIGYFVIFAGKLDFFHGVWKLVLSPKSLVFLAFTVTTMKIHPEKTRPIRQAA